MARLMIEEYLKMLEDTMIVFRLPVRETKLRVCQRTLKLYWTDRGVLRVAQCQPGGLAIEEAGIAVRWARRMNPQGVHGVGPSGL